MMKSRYLWLLFFGGYLFAQGPATLNFYDLAPWVEKSPEYQVLTLNRGLTGAQRGKAMAWASPYLSYTVETLGSQSESIAFINQTIPLPWHRGPLRRSWKQRIQAADLRLDTGIYFIHSRLRLGFVSLALAREALAITVALQASGQQLKAASKARREEGGSSKVDEALILWTHSQLQGLAQRRAVLVRQIESDLRLLIGLSPTGELSLETPVSYASIELPSLPEATGLWEKGAVSQAWKHDLAAAEMALQAAKVGAFSALSVQGGTKTAEGAAQGLVLGLSIPLPLLGQSRANKRLRQSELNLTKIEYESYLRESQSGLRQLYQTISDLDFLLSQTRPQSEDDKSLVALQSAYGEGWLSLPDYLTALQIRAATVETYYRQLSDYYDAIFTLENLTGVRFLTFSEAKEEN